MRHLPATRTATQGSPTHTIPFSLRPLRSSFAVFARPPLCYPTGQDGQLPRRVRPCGMKYLFGIILLVCSALGAAQTPKSGEVKPHHGRPTIFINGVPQAPAFYALTHAYGGRWSWEEVPARGGPQHRRSGLR